MRPIRDLLLRRVALAVLAGLLLASCAAQRLQREGMALIDAGQFEQGLAKLSESSRADPANLSYRMVLARQREQALVRLLGDAGKARAAGDSGTARALYEQVLRIDPANNNARTGLGQLEMDRRHAALLAEAAQAFDNKDEDAAQALVRRILLEAPEHTGALALRRRLDEQSARIQSGLPSLQGKFRRPVTLQFRDANIKMVFEALARASGVNVLLDKDVKPDLKISIFVKDVAVEDAIDLILLQSQMEKKIVSDSTVLLYQNTPAKLKEYQDLKIRSFHLVNADAKQILTMIKTMLKTKDIFVHERTNSVVMRDTPEAVELAARLVEDQDLADPEVMLELEVLEISGSRLSELGVKFPSSLTLSVPASAGLTLDSMRRVRSGDLLVGPAPAVSLNMLLQDGDSNLLASPRIRARNHEKAKIMIGDRVPVITNAVTPVSTGTPVVTGNVQYLDVGLRLEVEPDIHPDNEVSIKLNLEVSSIVKEVQNAQSGTLAYQVGTRNATTVLRLKDGETQVLGGLLSDEDRNSASRVPGLGQLPLLGRMFSTHKDDLRKTEIVLSITPHIIGNRRLANARQAEYWAGTEAGLRSNPLMLRQVGTVAAAGPVAGAGNGGRLLKPAPAGSSPATQPMVVSMRASSQVKAGEQFSVTLDAQSTQAVGRLGLVLSFDPAAMKVVDVTEGDFMRQNGAPSNFTRNIDPSTGKVTLDLAAGTTGGASGAGTLATVLFEALSNGSASDIVVSSLSPATPGGDPLAATGQMTHALTVTP